MKKTIKMGGVNLEIESLDFDLDEFSKGDFREIPGFISESKEEPQVFLEYVNHESEITYEREADNIIKLQAPRREVSAKTLIYAGYPLTETVRQRNNALTCHAASVDLGGEGVLLLGKEGAGKSTVAISLCKDYDAKLIGNDLSVIESGSTGIILRYGNQVFHLRKESVRKNMPELLHFFPDSQLDSWRQKAVIDPTTLNIQSTMDGVALKVALIVHIDQEQSDLYVKEESRDFVTKLVLYENFSRYIRTTCVPGISENGDFLYYMPSFDTKDLYLKRLELLEKLLNLPLLYISGTKQKITKFISELT